MLRRDETFSCMRKSATSQPRDLQNLILLPLDQNVCTPNHLCYLPELNSTWHTDERQLDDAIPEPTGHYSLGWGYAFPLTTLAGERRGCLYLHHGTPLGEQWGLEVQHHTAPEHLRRLNHQQPAPSPAALAELEELIKA